MVCSISNVAFSFLGLPIYWYSLAYIFGIVIALKLSVFFSKWFKSKALLANLDDFISAAIIGIILGGRLGHVLFYDFVYYLKFPEEILKIWKGGMSFYGGFIGVISVAYWFCRKHQIVFLEFMDLWSLSVPVGLFLGRMANFANAELLGKESNVPWSVVFRDGIHRHPSQLYEAFLEGILLFFVMLVAFKAGFYQYKGRLSGIFCTGYGIARFCAEFFREPDSEFSRELLYFSGLNLNQYMSIILTVVGVILILKSKKI
ncbi:MAG: prolipoprotein diacylglyceryl transferase [Holosporaceae bacterium]|jgi:phosphatidylglycerol:prolipoprotein diacylglycerol transferase|nr:prolipoprotein diacylglyceryl transferase [Holosporaceae bacterium]